MRNSRLANRRMPIRRNARYMTRMADRMSLDKGTAERIFDKVIHKIEEDYDRSVEYYDNNEDYMKKNGLVPSNVTNAEEYGLDCTESFLDFLSEKYKDLFENHRVIRYVIDKLNSDNYPKVADIYKNKVDPHYFDDDDLPFDYDPHLTDTILSKKSGFSNNSDYFGDWFGDGQIDYTKIINPNDSGDVYLVKLWCGSGYATNAYLVKANNLYDAIDRVFEWSYRNDGENYCVYDYHNVEEEAKYLYNENGYYERGKKPSDDMEFEDFLDDFIDEYYIGNSDYMLFANSENFFVDKVPEKYLKKKSSMRRAAIRRNFRRI